ncbi:hypothetical protein F4803DRAFT_466654 [Xylaria telfairii]|nr:hypothetical protein F4803DRAFT_466654 [Xylaria telfairii]
MKLLTSIIIASLGVALAFPAQQEEPTQQLEPSKELEPAQQVDPSQQDEPVESDSLLACVGLLYNTGYCCSEGFLGLYTKCEVPEIPPITVIDFRLQCALAGKEAYCCLRPLIGKVPLICSVP